MKKYLYILIIPLLTACFHDRGNYEYSEINEITIDVSSIPTEYHVMQYEELVVKPDIKFSQSTVSDENLDYTWSIFNNHYTTTHSDILSKEPVLNEVIKQNSSATSYTLLLEVKDQITGVAAQQRFTVWINSKIISGLMVLHSKNGESDIDYIATPNAVPTLTETRWMRDVYSLVNGNKMIGEGQFIAGARKNNTVINHVYAGTTNELYKVNGKTFELELTSGSNMFTIVPPTINPQSYQIGGTYSNYQFLLNDGQLHMFANQLDWETTFSYALLPNPSTLGADELDLAPFIYIPEDFPSTTQFGGVFYDNIGQKFIVVPNGYMPVIELSRFVDQVGAIFDVNNIGKQILHFESGYNNHGYAVFKDNDSDNRWLYIAQFNTPMSSNMALSKHDMSALPDISIARFYSTGNRGNVLLYATDRSIYTYDYNGSNSAMLINDDFPTGEEITCMKIYKPGTVNNLGTANGALLYVATWDGVEGRLYEFSLNEANGYLRNKAPLNTFDGFGKISDINHKIEGTGTGS